MNQEFRLYTLVNWYLRSIQQGIQSAHVTHSLFVKYPTESESSILWDWAKNDKTMIVLNGGMASDISSAFEALQHLKVEHNGEPLPIECFYEDESLNGMMTAFGVVVPRCFYDARLAKNDKTGEDVYIFDTDAVDEEGVHIERTVYHSNTAEFLFINIIKSCGLAT